MPKQHNRLSLAGKLMFLFKSMGAKDRMHILITGGTGFIGLALSEYFAKMGYSISILTRNITNKALPANVTLLNDLSLNEQPFDVIINLAGEPLSKKRWNSAFKQKIYDSRINMTNLVIDYIKQCHIKPKVLLSASAIGFYGDSLDEIFNEESQQTHQTFPQKLCHDWEERALQAQKYGVRVCILRLGVVLEKHGGALAEMVTPFKLGLGATLGHGKQWMSWVHLNDVVGMIDFLMHHSDLNGPFNLTAPAPVTNKEFTKMLAKQLRRPSFLNMPRCVAKIAFGEMAGALLLSGQNVVPYRIRNAGYIFKHPTLKDALATIFK